MTRDLLNTVIREKRCKKVECRNVNGNLLCFLSAEFLMREFHRSKKKNVRCWNAK